MSMLLKQSTVKVVQFGPFVDKTDGVTPETGLVSALDHASTGIMLSKDGAALAVRHATVTATTYDAYGNYRVTLDTTDTGTLGGLRVQFIETATCLPVWRDFIVVPANIYDSLVGGTDLLDSSLVQIMGSALGGTAAQIAAAFQKFFDKSSPTGTVNSIPDAVPDAAGGLPVTGTRLTAIPWNAAWDAEVQSEVDDAINTAISELAQGAPTATPTLRTAVMLLYMAMRNALPVDATTKKVSNDAGTVIAKKVLTDDGTTYTEAKMVTGP